MKQLLYDNRTNNNNIVYDFKISLFSHYIFILLLFLSILPGPAENRENKILFPFLIISNLKSSALNKKVIPESRTIS